MALVTQRCIWCSQRLQVPADATTTVCSGCQTVNPARNREPFGRLVAVTMTRLPSIPRVHGKKRAVLCGVSYRHRRCELKGTANDVECMKTFLRDKFGFPEDCILILSEDEMHKSRIPTKQNIRSAMQWLVQGSQAGDSLVFHFSGLGVQQEDTDGDEIDGFDEALCPMDYEREGIIVDDEINETLIRPLPYGAKLHAVIDASHSGTVLDLPYDCRIARDGFYKWMNQTASSACKGTQGGLAVCFSSCHDDQTSDHTWGFTAEAAVGAMTYCFVQALELKPKATYGEVLTTMRSAIRDVQNGIRNSGPIASLLRKMLRTGLTADPQLSASEQFDIYGKQFAL